MPPTDATPSAASVNRLLQAAARRGADPPALGRSTPASCNTLTAAYPWLPCGACGSWQHSTTDITFLLGFAEPSVFVRSFRRRTGQTPGSFRRAAQG